MKYGKTLIGPIHWAISLGKVPEDIVQVIQNSLECFKQDTALFDSADLQGAAKRAEMLIKLGYWLAVGQLSEKEFRVWADCIPPEDNAGWDVDLLHAMPGSHFRYVLKMGPLVTRPEACLVQDAAQNVPRHP